MDLGRRTTISEGMTCFGGSQLDTVSVVCADALPSVANMYKRPNSPWLRPNSPCQWATEAATAGDYEALREMGGWSKWAAMAHYVSAGKDRRRKIAERF